MKKKYIRPQIEVLEVENVQPFSASPIGGQTDHADSRRHDYDDNFFDDEGAFGSVEWKNDVGFQNKVNLWD